MCLYGFLDSYNLVFHKEHKFLAKASPRKSASPSTYACHYFIVYTICAKACALCARSALKESEEVVPGTSLHMQGNTILLPLWGLINENCGAPQEKVSMKTGPVRRFALENVITGTWGQTKWHFMHRTFLLRLCVCLAAQLLFFFFFLAVWHFMSVNFMVRAQNYSLRYTSNVFSNINQIRYILEQK